MGRWSLLELSKKGKKGKGGRDPAAKRRKVGAGNGGRNDSSLCSGSESEPGKSCCCPLLLDCKSGELSAIPTCLSQVLAPSVRMKEVQNESVHPMIALGLLWRHGPVEGIPSKNAGAPAG
jgi:hypothetical protein